ncbi:hypothetical protein JG687_00019039 [Phytophthora cactorum]|uniref:Uncharacterized protein n=1 Tax=Phytophthora cactorum TaxID=29920 RepID=A0A8T1TKE3_9STRA|nr:hypothetical protein JG687_00019039 [Phytophthora cactorum]
MEENGTGRRGRLPWRELWRSSDEIFYQYFKVQLPRFTTDKTNLTHCTMNHVDRGEYCLAESWHEMRCKLTKCASKRCTASGEQCRARY